LPLRVSKGKNDPCKGVQKEGEGWKEFVPKKVIKKKKSKFSEKQSGVCGTRLRARKRKSKNDHLWPGGKKRKAWIPPSTRKRKDTSKKREFGGGKKKK